MFSRVLVKHLLLSSVNSLWRRSLGAQLTSDRATSRLSQLSSFQLTRGTKTDAFVRCPVERPIYNSRRLSSVSSAVLAAADTPDRELTQGPKNPAMERIAADTDDLHSIGQKPITFLRQVVALATHPALLSSPAFPDDAKARAARIISSCYGNSIGSCPELEGIETIRNDVADFISRRDGGIQCDVDDIFLYNGAADAIDSVLKIVATGKDHPNQTGFMIPAPGYPLFRELIAGLNSYPISYYLDESSGWDLTTEELQRALDSAREHCQPRALVVINPSNPTGHVLSKRSIENVIRFAKRENLVIIADEVYQQSVFASGVEFHSFKKVLVSLGEPYERMELASIMSASKGVFAECGFRGGYCEVINLDPEIKNQLIKFISAKSSTAVPGQIAVDIVVKPPMPSDPSYDQFQQETEEILNRMRMQAATISRALNAVEGISCIEPTAAPFLFPRIQMPPKAIQEAQDQGLQPDEFYCHQLLEETGISLKPGTGFGQKDGHHHFRITMLPSLVQMGKLLEKLKNFHLQFLSFYSSDKTL